MSAKATKTIQQRLDSLSDPPNEYGCRLWHGATDGNGYGQIHVHGKTQRAARVALAMKTGRELPSNIDACHDCDRFYETNDRTYRLCVNADHLFAGTRSENMQDCANKGRHARVGMKGDDHPSRKHPEKLMRGAAWRAAHLDSIPRGDGHYARRDPRRGDACNATKYSSEVLAQVEAELRSGKTIADCVRRFGISQTHVCRIKRGVARLVSK